MPPYAAGRPLGHSLLDQWCAHTPHGRKMRANLVKLPKTQMWLNYDSDADVLYLHFEEKPSSNHSETRDDGIILDYKDDLLVGLTVLEASHR